VPDGRWAGAARGRRGDPGEPARTGRYRVGTGARRHGRRSDGRPGRATGPRTRYRQGRRGPDADQGGDSRGRVDPLRNRFEVAVAWRWIVHTVVCALRTDARVGGIQGKNDCLTAADSVPMGRPTPALWCLCGDSQAGRLVRTQGVDHLQMRCEYPAKDLGLVGPQRLLRRYERAAQQREVVPGAHLHDYRLAGGAFWAPTGTTRAVGRGSLEYVGTLRTHRPQGASASIFPICN